jgi:hypothetical protein
VGGKLVDCGGKRRRLEEVKKKEKWENEGRLGKKSKKYTRRS